MRNTKILSMKHLFKAANISVILALLVGLASCSDSDDELASGEVGTSSGQINENAIVQTITSYNSDGTIGTVYEFEYDENNRVMSWTKSGRYYYDNEECSIKYGEGTIAITDGYGDYGYENGYITKTCWGNAMTYENGKLVKGEFSTINWNGDNITHIVRSGEKHEYTYSELLNNASINFNAFFAYNMNGMIDDEDGEEFVAFGLAAGTRTRNLISEIETGFYDSYDGYLGPHKEVITYETDSNNRVIKITITDDRREYGGSIYNDVIEITYRQ